MDDKVISDLEAALDMTLKQNERIAEAIQGAEKAHKAHIQVLSNLVHESMRPYHRLKKIQRRLSGEGIQSRGQWFVIHNWSSNDCVDEFVAFSADPYQAHALAEAHNGAPLDWMISKTIHGSHIGIPKPGNPHTHKYYICYAEADKVYRALSDIRNGGDL